MLKRLADWLEDRTGLPGALRRVLEEPVPGGARWSFVLGSAVLFTLAVQALTGILLALNYAPTSDAARASIVFIQGEVSGGSLVRGLHHWGAGGMIALVGCHLLQVFLWGAYRRPREATWIAGVLLLLLTLAFAFTGSLLPWDQNAYWATQVGANILGTAPLAGRALQRILQGGAQIGNLTLTRFYTLHVIVLPVMVTGLVAAHLALFLKRGVTPRWSLSEEEQHRRREPFFPGQFARDALAMLLALIVLLVLAARVPPGLGAPADPSRPYDARPDWYFLWLFEMLKHFQGPLEPVGTFVLPGLAFLFLLTIPFLDRSPERRPLGRLPVVIPVLVGALVVGSLTAQSLLGGREERAAWRAQEKRREEILARGWAFIRTQPCLKCHTIGGTGRDVGPNLSRYGLTAPGADAIVTYLKNPKAKYPNTVMPSFATLPEDDLRLIADFLRLQGVD